MTGGCREREAVVRVELPSGGWWELDGRPTWGRLRKWAAGAARPGDGQAADRVLASLTAAWSFDDEVHVSALSRRLPHDLTAAFDALHDRVLSPLTEPVRDIAEELFAGLVSGRVPEQFTESHVMAIIGWDWATLQRTPADVVRHMVLYLLVREARAGGASLDFERAP